MTLHQSQLDLPPPSHAARWGRAVLGVCAMCLAAGFARGAMVDRYWDVSPYRIHVLVDYRTSAVWQQRLEGELPHFLVGRAKVAVGPLWRTSVETAAGGPATVTDVRLLALSDQRLADLRADYDKVMVLAIEEGPLGMRVAAQEYDCLLESWGPVMDSTTRNSTDVRGLSFAMLREAFSPMATFRVIRESTDQVELTFRGAGLPRVSDGLPLVSEDAVLRPVLRRVDRTGQPVEDGIQPVPWTYLSIDALDTEVTTATVHSHTRAPLGVRQRGRVDQLAAVVRPTEQTTRLRLHPRDRPEISLAGFRVYRQDVGDEGHTYLGKTGRDGRIVIPPGKTPIQVVYVQSSGEWIAKIPVVPGADGRVEAPVLDDQSRLEAEAKLTAIREELIDVVARRNILASRVRAKIQAGDLEAANQLIRELESMPTATEFEQQRIRQQERLIESEDPRIQQRIEKMFSDTRDVLSEFLSPGLVRELEQEVAAAGSTAQQ